MFSRYTKLKFKRRIRHQQKAIEKAGDDANKHFEYHVVRRWRNLREVKRFVIGWLLLVVLLMTGVYVQGQALQQHYQTDMPIAGGVYREAIHGQFSNINPIYASTNADLSASKLLFNSLLRYDNNGEIIGDLASSWEVDESNSLYTVKLRDDIYWHDGMQLTAEDVVFTYNTIKHPDSRSVLNSSWQGIKVQSKDDFTVTFSLPNPYTPFPHSLTNGGILPKHILGGVDPSQMRGHPFNMNEPVGTGPFTFDELIQVDGAQQLSVNSFDKYHLSEPHISQVVLIGYDSEERMLNAFENKEVAGVAGVNDQDYQRALGIDETNIYDLPLTNGVYMFMKTSEPVLDSPEIRKGITRAIDQNSILKELEGRFVAVNSPLLKDQVGYDEEITQSSYKPERSKELFDQSGWKVAEDGIRVNKDGERLSFTLLTQNSDNYPQVAEMIKRQLSEVGVELNVILANEDQIQSTYIVPHNYELLLSGITIGHDPDVFAYWHSSQTGPGGFNLSEYESVTADVSLEAGRTRTGDDLRDVKYEPFLTAWKDDAPGVGLFQPSFIYAHQNRLHGFEPYTITSSEERFNTVHEWKINTRPEEKPY